jgi:hypothetical protein
LAGSAIDLPALESNPALDPQAITVDNPNTHTNNPRQDFLVILSLNTRLKTPSAVQNSIEAQISLCQKRQCSRGRSFLNVAVAPRVPGQRRLSSVVFNQERISVPEDWKVSVPVPTAIKCICGTGAHLYEHESNMVCLECNRGMPWAEFAANPAGWADAFGWIDEPTMQRIRNLALRRNH